MAARWSPATCCSGSASTGFHSNGYSLVRKVFLDEARLELGQQAADLEQHTRRGIAPPDPHLRQGLAPPGRLGPDEGRGPHHRRGLVDNPTRMFAAGAKLKLQIDMRAWQPPPVFAMLARLGRVAPEEMRRTFNMGIGMIVAVPAGAADAAQSILELEGEKVFTIGSVQTLGQVDTPVEFIA